MSLPIKDNYDSASHKDGGSKIGETPHTSCLTSQQVEGNIYLSFLTEFIFWAYPLKKIFEYLIIPFHSYGKPNKVILMLFLLINLIVLYNTFHHPHYIAYDAVAHNFYIISLANFNLPTPWTTPQYYSPPLVYLIPAMLLAIGKFSFDTVLNFAQLLNVVYSIGTTFFMIRICDMIRPQNHYLKIGSLVFIGMLPAYYRTFAFIRGEPLLTFLSVYSIYKTLSLMWTENHRLSGTIMLGMSLGLAILTRQFGFLIFLSFFIFNIILLLKAKEKRLIIFKSTLIASCIAFCVGGWFYILLKKEYSHYDTYIVKKALRFRFRINLSNFFPIWV